MRSSGVGSGAGVVFGVEKNSGEAIRRSTDYGATWSPWATAPEPFRPIDSKPVLVTDQLPGRAGHDGDGEREGLSDRGRDRPTIRKIFDLRAQIGAGYPAYELYHCAFDPRDADIGLHHRQRLRRALGLPHARPHEPAPTWTDISGNGPRQPRKIFVHPVTGDVITSYHHGSMILPPPEG